MTKTKLIRRPIKPEQEMDYTKTAGYISFFKRLKIAQEEMQDIADGMEKIEDIVFNWRKRLVDMQRITEMFYEPNINHDEESK